MNFSQKKAIFLIIITLSIGNSSCSLLKNKPQLFLPNVSLNTQQLAQVETRSKEISQKLNLSKQLQQKIKDAVKKYAIKILAIRQSSYSGSEKIKLAKTQVSVFEDKLKNILNEEQFANYMFFKKERHKKFYNKK